MNKNQNENDLNEIERDFIEFISVKRNCPYKEIEDIYLTTKDRFKFSSSKYRKLTDTVHNIHKVMYDDKSEKELIDSYKFHALMHLFRFISYSYPKSYSNYLKILIKVIIKGDFNKLSDFLKRKISNKSKNVEATGTGGYSNISKVLVEKIDKAPIVVDYGCGLGDISFAIGKLEKKSKVYLIDIDCLTLEFTEFRFNKHQVNVEIIPVSKNNLYPKLPVHNICIATEVMEHLIQPLKAYQNIKNSLQIGGMLYGNFGEHNKEMFHVSPDLSELRYRLNEDFKKIGDMVYRKIK